MKKGKFIQTLPGDKGVALMKDMIKNNYIAEITGKSPSLITVGVTHKRVNNTDYYYTIDMIQTLQSACRIIGRQLLSSVILPDIQLQDEYPFCYGENYIEKFNHLRSVINIQYLFSQLGWSERKIKYRLSSKGDSGYGRFSLEEIDDINQELRKMALTLLGLTLEYQEPPIVRHEDKYLSSTLTKE